MRQQKVNQGAQPTAPLVNSRKRSYEAEVTSFVYREQQYRPVGRFLPAPPTPRTTPGFSYEYDQTYNTSIPYNPPNLPFVPPQPGCTILGCTVCHSMGYTASAQAPYFPQGYNVYGGDRQYTSFPYAPLPQEYGAYTPAPFLPKGYSPFSAYAPLPPQNDGQQGFETAPITGTYSEFSAPQQPNPPYQNLSTIPYQNNWVFQPQQHAQGGQLTPYASEVQESYGTTSLSLAYTELSAPSSIQHWIDNVIPASPYSQPLNMLTPPQSFAPFGSHVEAQQGPAPRDSPAMSSAAQEVPKAKISTTGQALDQMIQRAVQSPLGKGSEVVNCEPAIKSEPGAEPEMLEYINAEPYGKVEPADATSLIVPRSGEFGCVSSTFNQRLY